MSKITINLLPPEITAQEKKKTKFYRIQTAGIAITLTMVFLTSLTIALRVLQSRNIAAAQESFDSAQQKVLELKNTQTSLFLLKDRLAAINQHWGVSSKQSTMYNLIDRLVPPSVVINAITIDKNGDAVFLALVPDSTTLDELIINLTTKENNDGKISQVSVDSLNRGRDGLYRVSFKVKS